jgi:hypothetical protein
MTATPTPTEGLRASLSRCAKALAALDALLAAATDLPPAVAADLTAGVSDAILRLGDALETAREAIGEGAGWPP